MKKLLAPSSRSAHRARNEFRNQARGRDAAGGHTVRGGSRNAFGHRRTVWSVSSCTPGPIIIDALLLRGRNCFGLVTKVPAAKVPGHRASAVNRRSRGQTERRCLGKHALGWSEELCHRIAVCNKIMLAARVQFIESAGSVWRCACVALARSLPKSPQRPAKPDVPFA